MGFIGYHVGDALQVHSSLLNIGAARLASAPKVTLPGNVFGESLASLAKLVVRTEPMLYVYETMSGFALSSWESMNKIDTTAKLRRAPQPPLSHPGATPDSDRAKRPLLVQPFPPESELNTGDRVEGLGNFGKPTGELGTIEQSNEEDAVAKSDDDGRTRLHQPWLKKV